MSSLSPRRGLAAFAFAAATIVVLCAASGAVSAPLSDAPDGPGALSHFDLARKDCLGTARNTTSKVWFTVADGVLSDVYYPTIDNTNVETLQYVVTDGSTFTDLQTRDMTYTVARARRHRRDGLPRSRACRRTAASTGSSPTTSPTRRTNALLMQVAFEREEALEQAAPLPPLRPDRERQRRRRERATAAPTPRLTDTSTGHPVLVASDPSTATNAANRDYAQPVYAALDAPFADDHERLRRHRERRAHAARHLARADDLVHEREQRQRRPDRADRGRQEHDDGGEPRLHRRARLRLDAGGRRADRGGRARRRVRPGARRLGQGWAAYDAAAQATRRRASGDQRKRVDELQTRVLRQRERAEGVRGQDVPRRDRREHDLAVGPGDLRRRPGEHLLRLLPRGLRPRPVRDLDRPDGRRRHARRRATRRSSCSTASSRRTARCRATASSTARPRRTRSAPSWTRRRTRC